MICVVDDSAAVNHRYPWSSIWTTSVTFSTLRQLALSARPTTDTLTPTYLGRYLPHVTEYGVV